ncbi:MAG: class I SAM-dependent methyltransferase [Kangiellaceae bacterium]|nr:class I SAM-dependent methyltransferase [Kangiellaceae bacterium]
MHKSVKFWDRMADGYSKKAVPDEAVYQKKLAATQSYLTTDMSVLEFACGTGSTAIEHTPYVKDYLAIDISSKMLEIAESKTRLVGIDNLDFSVDSFESFQAPSDSYDAILGLSILHLMDNPELMIEKAYRLLKQGGVFVSSTACIQDRMPLLKYIGPIAWSVGLIPKLNIFSQTELEEMLINSGFTFEYQLTKEEGSDACFYICKK